MLKKIISGGQTGANRAALDFAIEFDIPHGGWVRKGRKAEDGVLPDEYRLAEMPTDSDPKHIERNVIDGDGTLMLSHGELTGRSALSAKMAEKHHRPWLHIDFTETNGFEAARAINTWIIENEIETLNVAGPSASKDPEIYDATYKTLAAAFHLASLMTSMDRADEVWRKPKTVDEAVDIIISKLTFKDKVRVARMSAEEASALPMSLGDYIWVKFGLKNGNDALFESCSQMAKADGLHRESAIDVIAEAVWRKLRKTHALRPI